MYPPLVYMDQVNNAVHARSTNFLRTFGVLGLFKFPTQNLNPSIAQITMVKSTVTLASGKQMPLVGFGLWKVPQDSCADTVYNVSLN